MKRRSRGSSKPAKERRRQPARIKRARAPNAVRLRSASTEETETQVAHLSRELQKSLAREDATSKVLRVISSSPGDLKPVFEAILENAVRLCGAKFGNLYLCEGDGFRAAAMHNAPRAYAEQRAGLVRPSPHSSLWQAAQTKLPAQIEGEVLILLGIWRGASFA